MRKIFLASAGSHVASDIARQVGKSKKLLYITTAAEAEEGDLWWLRDDRNGLVEAGFVVQDYTITGKRKEEIAAAFAKTDVLCFSGGNNFYLLEKILETQCAETIRESVEKGKIYFGISAGAIVAGPDIEPLYFEADAKKAPALKSYRGLGLVDFVVLPHWGSPYFREFYLKYRLERCYTTGHKMILLTDHQYVYVKGDMYQIIESGAGVRSRN